MIASFEEFDKSFGDGFLKVGKSCCRPTDNKTLGRAGAFDIPEII